MLLFVLFVLADVLLFVLFVLADVEVSSMLLFVLFVLADVEVSGTTAIIKQQGDPDINALVSQVL